MHDPLGLAPQDGGRATLHRTLRCGRLPLMVPESRLESTEHGLVPKGDGWFVLNAREARWYHGPGRSAICEFEGEFEGEQDFLQLGINLSVLRPGEPMAMYHWEADQEDFLVLAGEALLIVEGAERPLRQWDLVHCPAETKHVIVGAGDAPCLVLAVGARDRSTGPDWGGYTVERPFATTRASSRRRPTNTRRTRDSPSANQPRTARAGFPNKCWARAPLLGAYQAAV